MSVRIRLNNKKFLGESLLIGSRLHEGQVPNGQATPAATGQTAAAPAQTPAQPAATPAQTPVQPTANATPTAAPAQTPAANANTQNANGQGQNQQGNVAQRLQQIYINHFKDLQAAIANDLKQIEGVQWAQNVQPKDQTFNSIMAALQEYMKANVEAAKKAVEASAQQGQGGNAQNTSTNTNVNNGQ